MALSCSQDTERQPDSADAAVAGSDCRTVGFADDMRGPCEPGSCGDAGQTSAVPPGAGDGASLGDTSAVQPPQALQRDPLDERLKSFEEDRDAGMKAWLAGDVANALEHWAMARGSLKYVVDKGFLDHDLERLAKVKEDHYKMHLNLAQGFLKTGEWRQVLEYAGRALAYDANSEKALYRTCLAFKELSQFDDARQWIERLLQAHPANSAGKQLSLEVDRLEKASQKTARKAAGKIFKGMQEDHDHRVEPKQETWRQWLERACCRRRKAD